MKPLLLVRLALGSLLVLTGLTLLYVWTACRVYVGPNECLVLIRKTGAERPAGQIIAEPGQKGIQREALGPGRYFFNPWVWEWEKHRLVEVPAGEPASWRELYDKGSPDFAPPKLAGQWPQVGIVTDLVGKPAPGNEVVVEEGFRGTQRTILTPGTYRINPHIYKVELANAVIVPVGCCGVVTSQAGDHPGFHTVQETSIGPDGQPVQDPPKVLQRLATMSQRGVVRDVLPPGIYYLNPKVHTVDIVQIGYNQISQMRTADAETMIQFPSRDGFTIEVEVTVVWGRHPAHMPEMINRLGNVEKMKQIILGQIRSICRNIGSGYDSTDFIRGEKRELYQRAVTETLRRVCRERDIDVLIALIHNIEVHGGSQAAGQTDADLKKTIQRGFIAKEQDLTKQTQRETAKVRAELESSKAAIEVAREQISADTRKKVAQLKAEGQKRSEEIDADRDLKVARVEREIATLAAETALVLGQARTQVERLRYQAEADGKRLMVDALGSGTAYNLYTFAQGFSPESIRLIFAGEGTFWTDLKSAQDAANLELLNGAPAVKP